MFKFDGIIDFLSKSLLLSEAENDSLLMVSLASEPQGKKQGRITGILNCSDGKRKKPMPQN
jgi:hypothetical protein